MGPQKVTLKQLPFSEKQFRSAAMRAQMRVPAAQRATHRRDRMIMDPSLLHDFFGLLFSFGTQKANIISAVLEA